MRKFLSNSGGLILCIVICLLVGFLGSFFTTSAISTWYKDLAKPWFTPPSWVFAPVWTILYVLMGISLYIIVKSGFETPVARISITVFIIQLVLNVLWSYLFFSLKSPLAGFIDIILLWISIFVCILLFKKISLLASIIQIPYILWVSFAMILNFSIMMLNF
jgi:translocator protein